MADWKPPWRLQQNLTMPVGYSGLTATLWRGKVNRVNGLQEGYNQ